MQMPKWLVRAIIGAFAAAYIAELLRRGGGGGGWTIAMPHDV
jgi:hypothetical protein